MTHDSPKPYSSGRLSLAVAIGLIMLGSPVVGSAAAPEQLSVEAADGPVALTRYAADHAGTHPAVLVLHGLRGFERKPRAYERYAERLAATGIDVYLVTYTTVADLDAFAGMMNATGRRVTYEATRFDGWSKRISSVVAAVLARPDCSGKIGLLGFSLGGYIAAEAASQDPRVTALAVMYGGMPAAMTGRVTRLPPLLELHGRADHNVSLAEGEALVRLARQLGGPAELVSYPGRGHGFDFSDTDPMTSDAIGRVVEFFRTRLDAVPR